MLIFNINVNAKLSDCCIKSSIISLILFLFIFKYSYAESIIDLREEAKSSYYSGDLKKSLSIFNKISKTGDAESQYYLGLIYLTEDVPWKDIPKAISYLRSSSDQNNAEAMWKLGDLYDNGLGVKKDLLIALDWYRKSKRSVTLKSNIQFQKNLNGKTMPQSTLDLVSDITKSALDNKVEAQFKLANIYYDGQLVEPDDKQAFGWYFEAAKNSHSYSMLMTGYMYCRGIGVEKDINKANKWLEKTTNEAYCH